MQQERAIKAVILDLDQTLTEDTGSWTQFTTLLGADSNKLQVLYERFRLGEIPYDEAKRGVISLWGETGPLTRKRIRSLFEQIRFRPHAESAISYLRSKYRLCIISGAIDQFVEIVARKLNIEDWYASTRFIFDESDTLVDFYYTLSRGEEKIGFLKQFCSKESFPLNACAAIGDGDSDMPIFEVVSLPILFVAGETTVEQQKRVNTRIRSWTEIKQVL